VRSALSLTLCSYLIILAGCADAPADGTTVQEQLTDGTDELSAALVDTDWHWAYYTAALGGDYDTWLTFDGGGNARWTREFWVYDYAEGGSSYPVESVVGQYSHGPFNRVDVVFEDPSDPARTRTKSGAPAEFYFTGAVSQTLPKLAYDDGVEVLTAVGHGLTTRAFAATGLNQWRSEYGHQDGSRTHDAVVTVDIDFDADECSMVLHLELSAEVDGMRYQADETTPALPCRFERVQEGIFAINDSLINHDDRASLLEELGGEERHGAVLYYKLTEAMQFLYFRPNATPHLLLPNGNNVVQDAWWTPRKLPAIDGV
jgi:hypothetical protein